MTAIGYTCVVIIIKYIFSFKFWDKYGIFEATQSEKDRPFWTPQIVGLKNRSGVRYLDIAQLLVLFFQRGLLKVHGLWENYDERDQYDADQDIRPLETLGHTTREMISSVFQKLTTLIISVNLFTELKRYDKMR